MSIVDTLQAFHQQQLDFYGLLRQFLSNEEWCIPCKDNQPLLLKKDAETFLLLFSSQELFEKHNGTDLPSFYKTGDWIAHNLSSDITAVIIDPNEAHATLLPNQYFPLLHKLSKSIAIEHLLEGNHTQQNAIEMLKNFEHYLVPIIQDSTGLTHITLAPDTQGRQLAAVFTAEDCLQAFVTASQNLLGDDLKVDEISGNQLFSNLKQLSIEGVVFNCNGPILPRALSKDFLLLLTQ